MNFVKYLLFYIKLLNYLFCNMFGSVWECYELTGVSVLWTRRALAIKALKSFIFILFSSDNSFVRCHGGKLVFIVAIFNTSDCCLLKRNKVPSPCVFCDHTTGGQCFKNLKQPCCMRSQSHGRLWPLLKLKFGNCWLTSKCCGSSCKKFNSGF